MAKRKSKELSLFEKLERLGKAKYGSKFIRVVSPDNQPFFVLEHKGYKNRKMEDGYGLNDGSIEKEYDEYFGPKYITCDEILKQLALGLEN